MLIKNALITGAACRIGASIAEELHSQGMNVLIHYRSHQAEAAALVGKLNKTRANSAVALHADLNDMLAITGLAHLAVKQWGRLDVLVNNASSFYPTPLGEVTEHTWDELHNSNLRAPFFLSQTLLPELKKAKGCIINIADIHGESPLRNYSAYCIAKAGLIMMTKALAKECGDTLRVNAIAPGAIIWPDGENELIDSAKQKIINKIPLGRHGEVEDIAKAVKFLVNDASYITGQVIRISGGRVG